MLRRLLTGLAFVGAVLLQAPAAKAGVLSVDICGPSAVDNGNFYTGDTGDGLSSSASPGMIVITACPAGNGLQLHMGDASGVPYNASAGYKVTAPAGIVINDIHVIGANSQFVGTNDGWWGEFYWQGGPGPAGNSGGINDNFFGYGCCSQTNLRSQSIGWDMVCLWSSCSALAELNLQELQLTAEEDRGPQIIALSADNLWYQHGWVRGPWWAGINASDPSGACGAFVVFGSLPAFSGNSEFPDQYTWKQCSDQTVSATVDTRASQGSLGLGEGSMPLRLTATNAAKVTSNVSETVLADNEAPTVSLAGPTDASSSSGTQYLTATASAGPSGVAGISCSVDGSPRSWHPGRTALLPVAGVGSHTATCVSYNNARDSDGNLGSSSAQSFTMHIRQPTVLGISFSKLVDGLRCARVKERIKLRGRWKQVTVIRCHPTLVRRRVVVWSTVRRGGQLVRVKQVRVVNVVVPPHLIATSSQRVTPGAGTLVNGWLGTTNGTALGNQTVEVLAAANNGFGRFARVALAKTAANGSWRAAIPAGPSLLIEALYAGGSSTESAISGPVQTQVPASVTLHVAPARVRWGSRISISGRLSGGYIPASKTEVSQLLRLRIGIGAISQTAGIPDVGRDGRFRTSYCFNPGGGTEHFWFSVSTLYETDYPFTPAGSRRSYVTVGPGNAARPC